MDWFDIDFEDKGGVPFGLDTNGRIQDVADVPRGLSCGCICSECRGPLVAKKGEIKVHHFAHHDRRECRHAFEASLFQMAVELLSEPGSRLMLPSWGDRHRWVREALLDRDDPAVRKFLQEPAVIPSRIVEVGMDAIVRAKTADESSWPTADLELPAANVSIHLLTHRKPYGQRPASTDTDECTVIGINLCHYAKLWWGGICDDAREERVAEASSARKSMAEWLAEDASGRGILAHPESPHFERKFQMWAANVDAEQNQKKAEAIELKTKQREAEKEQWRVPGAKGNSESGTWWFKPARSEQIARLPSGLPRELGLLQDSRSSRWGWFGQPGQIVPSKLWTLLASGLPWEPSDHPPCPNPNKSTPHVSRQIVERTEQESTKPIAPIMLKKGVGTCQLCESPTDLLRHQSGWFSGKLVITCSANPKHPMVCSAESDWPDLNQGLG